MPLTASLAGAVAAVNWFATWRLSLRAVGVPLRWSPLTCLRAEPMGSDATSLAALAAPNATSSTVDVMSVLISWSPPLMDLIDALHHNALRQMCQGAG